MSRFTQPVTISQLEGSDHKWVVETEDLAWEIGELGSGDLVPIPKGTTTDLASVPRIFWAFLPPHGRHTNASILHDRLYDVGDERGRKWADQQFLEAMLALGVPPLRAKFMWWAVRIFGGSSWKGQS